MQTHTCTVSRSRSFRCEFGRPLSAIFGLGCYNHSSPSPASGVTAELFDVQQCPTESLKSYIAQFNNVTLKVEEQNEDIFVMASRKVWNQELSTRP